MKSITALKIELELPDEIAEQLKGKGNKNNKEKVDKVNEFISNDLINVLKTYIGINDDKLKISGKTKIQK